MAKDNWFSLAVRARQAYQAHMDKEPEQRTKGIADKESEQRTSGVTDALMLIRLKNGERSKQSLELIAKLTRAALNLSDPGSTAPSNEFRATSATEAVLLLNCLGSSVRFWAKKEKPDVEVVIYGKPIDRDVVTRWLMLAADANRHPDYLEQLGTEIERAIREIGATSAWSQIAGEYNSENMRQFSVLLVHAFNSINELKDSPEIIAYSAGAACAIAVALRSAYGIDLFTLSLPLQTPPLPPSHPIMVLAPPLDHIIEVHLKWLVASEYSDPQLVAANFTKLHAALVWKAYLFLLNTSSDKWGSAEFCALKVLHILSTAERDTVIGVVKRALDLAVRAHVRPEDWPPREFIRIYAEHRERIDKAVPTIRAGIAHLYFT